MWEATDSQAYLASGENNFEEGGSVQRMPSQMEKVLEDWSGMFGGGC